MLTIERTAQFKRDFKRMLRQGVDAKLFKELVAKLANEEKLDAKHKDHALKGNLAGYRECHITPDWLLVYRVINDELILTLARTGSHSYLFG